MGRNRTSRTRSFISDNVKLVTLTIFLGFGLSACAGSDEGTEEPVQSEEQAGTEGEGLSTEESSDSALPGGAENEPSSDGALTGEAPAGTDEAVPGFLEDASTPNAEAPAEPAAPTMAPGQADIAGNFTGNETAAPSGTSPTASQAAPAPAAPAATSPSTPPAGEGRYVVQSGDSVSRIARKIFGDTMRWKDVAATNQLSAPYVIHPGDTLRFPILSPKSQDFANKYEALIQEKTVTVQKGDTLGRIAKKIFGNSNAWKVLAAFNKDVISNPDRIEVGMVLKYPDPQKMKILGAKAPSPMPGSPQDGEPAGAKT